MVVLEEGETLRNLMARFPRAGSIEWIGIRPRRGAAVETVQSAMLVPDSGIEGDHKSARPGGKRQVTLIQWEHLPTVAGLCGKPDIEPGWLRRNFAVSGINLRALSDRRFLLGAALLEGTGYCHPCSRMEKILGRGGYNAMRGHGGITARIVAGGAVSVGDSILAADDADGGEAD